MIDLASPNCSLEEALWDGQVEALKVGCTWLYCRMNRNSVSGLARSLGNKRIFAGDGGVEMAGVAQALHVAPVDSMPAFAAELVNAAGEVVVKLTLSY